MITVEVCAAWPHRVLRKTLALTPGSCVADLKHHPDLPLELLHAWQGSSAQSIFGEIASDATRLKNGDRLELLRPLIADPKEARRNKARRTAKARARLKIAKDTEKRAMIRARRAAKEGG
jgi:putative ubiquitin-RnfH superfamily antitoxin RatB of RatAB toxin-antitoxin module